MRPVFAKRIWTYALVLTREYWEERPAFLLVLTPRYGVLEVKLRWGTQKRLAVFRQAALEPMTLSWLELGFHAGGITAYSWELVESFAELRRKRPEEMLEMGLWIARTVPCEDPVPEIFRHTLMTLKRGDADTTYPLLAAFASGFLGLVGCGVEELVGCGGRQLRCFLCEEPETVLSVCRGVLRDALGVEPWNR